MTSFVKAARKLSARLEEANVGLSGLSLGFEEKKGYVPAPVRRQVAVAAAQQRPVCVQERLWRALAGQRRSRRAVEGVGERWRAI